MSVSERTGRRRSRRRPETQAALRTSGAPICGAPTDNVITMRRWLTVAALGLAAFVNTHAQAPVTAPPSGLILGRVVDAATGRPVPGAIVQLIPDYKQTPILTGQDGQFLFSPLAAGFYRIGVSKPGYLESSYGQMRPRGEGTMLMLAENASRTDVILRLWPWGDITGRVTDEDGQPVVSGTVRAWFRGPNGRLDAEPFRFARTDSQGRYTIRQLRPGQYIVGFVCDSFNAQFKVDAPFASGVSSLVNQGEQRLLMDHSGSGFVSRSCSNVPTAARARARLYKTTFYGDATSPSSSSPIDVAAGETVHGLDFRLGIESGFRVAGRLDAPSALPGVYLRLGPSGWNDEATFGHQAAITPDGSFVFVAVPSGTYTVSASVNQHVWIQQTLTVDRDIDNLVVTAQPGIQISGQIQPADTQHERLSFELSLPGRKYPVQADAKGAFTIADLPPGRHPFFPRSTAGTWQIVSATFGGREVLGDTIDVGTKNMTGLVLYVSDRATTLAGSVVDLRGTADAATVVFFPANAGLWPNARGDSPLFRTARTWSGHYTLERVPAGDFLIAAVDDGVLENWPDASLLARIAAIAERIQMSAGQQIHRDLRFETGIR